jgi:outer membrane protein assembly factor BamB
MKNLMWVAVLLVAPSALRADDWPQFRGPQRDGVSRETGLLKEWPKEGPRLVWAYDKAGFGYSGPAVVGDRLYISCGRGDSEYLVALDLKNVSDGAVKEVWAAKIGPLFQWKGNSWNRGPNATPTVAGDAVYALGGFGDLICVDAAAGKERWRKSMPKDLGGEVNPIGGGLETPTPFGWGYAWAPLVDGDHVICVPGGPKGLLAALDKSTGKVVWQSKDVTDQASYSSPLAIDVGGVKQYVQVVNAGLVGVAVKDGKMLWSYRRDPAYDDVVVATPVFHDNRIYSTVGFGQGCDLIKLKPSGGNTTVETVFSNKTVDNRDGGVVLVDGHLYCYSERDGWVCQEFATGKIVWAEKRKLGHGSVTFADGNLYCCSEKDGVVALVAASPKGYAEKGRFKIPRQSGNRPSGGGMWTHPVVAHGKLFVRDQELLYCFELKP